MQDDLRDGLAKLEWACPIIINLVKRALSDPSFSKSYPDKRDAYLKKGISFIRYEWFTVR